MSNLSNYAVIVQVRTNSSRLKGKALLDVEGQPMLVRQLTRLRAGLRGLRLLVATSCETSDAPIEAICSTLEVPCYRGPLDDVMGRFIGCAQEHGVDFIIRVGGDDPLIDPECCNHLAELHSREPHDFMYASNREGWPYGTAAELISRRALETIHGKTTERLYLEHTIPYFFDHAGEFSILKVKAPRELNRPDYCLSVDYPEDLELVRTVFRRLRDAGPLFSMLQVIQLFDENPDIRTINSHLHSGFDR